MEEAAERERERERRKREKERERRTMTATSGASVKDTNEETDILVKMARQVRRKEGLDQKKKKEVTE